MSALGSADAVLRVIVFGGGTLGADSLDDVEAIEADAVVVD